MPASRWAMREILTAVSTASEPELQKNTRESPNGASPAMRAASFLGPRLLKGSNVW